MNLGKTWMGHMFKKKTWKKDNVGINNKYTSLLKNDSLKKIFLLEIKLKEINRKTCKYFLIWKINLGRCQNKFFFEKNNQCWC